MEQNPTRGYILVIAAALLWASSGTAGKYLFHTGLPPFALIYSRVILSSLILLVTFVLFNRRLLKIRIGDLPYFIILGSVVTALVQSSYFFAISKIQVAAAILLQYLAPILVALFSMLFWKERPSAVKFLALFLALAGCYLVVGGYNIELLKMNRAGIAWGMTSAVAFASYTLMSERGMHRYSPWTVIFYAVFFATVSLSFFGSPLRYLTASYDTLQITCVLYVAVMGTILPFGLYLAGINHIRSTRAIITATLEPISAALIAFLVLGETFEPLQILGGLLVIAAITSLQVQREYDELAPVLIRGRNETN